MMSCHVHSALRLDIALHDRYSLGCWRTDAYVSRYWKGVLLSGLGAFVVISGHNL